MKHPDGTPVRETERIVPDTLLAFLIALEHCQSTDDVWQAILDLRTRLELHHVYYVIAPDLQRKGCVNFTRTTFDAAWLDYVARLKLTRGSSNFEMYGRRYLTPRRVGLVYREQMGDVPQDKLTYMEICAEMGMSAGLAVPLRTGVAEQAGQITWGGAFDKARFDDILDRHALLLQAASMAAHLRYTAFFREEILLGYDLTDKQTDLIRLVGQGLMDKQIAHELGISFSAVRQRLNAIQAKTGVENRADLAALAMRLGLVNDPILRNYAEDMTVFSGIKDAPPRCEVRIGEGSPPR